MVFLNNKPVEIYENIFRVGAYKQINGLRINSYLMIDNGEGILFGPGSVIDFEDILANISEIIPVEKIKYVILHNQDPSNCSALPLFERNGFSGKVVTHWRSAVYVKHYDVSSDFIYSNLTANRLTLKSGRIMHFINTPYLKSAGSFAVYDTVSKILFSGDLFGAFGTNEDHFAREDYIEAMKKYHAEYMPGNYILRNILEIIMKKDISMIAPQYGSIIVKEIQDTISALMDVKCGICLTNVKNNTIGADGLRGICNDMLKYYYTIFPKIDVIDAFKDSGILIDETTGFINSYKSDISNLWNYFFEIIVSRKGLSWLALIEDELHKIVSEYGIEYPEIFNSSLYRLKEKYEKIEKEFEITDNRLHKDPLAQVYKEDMFIDNLISDIVAYRDIGINFAFFIIEIDNLNALNIQYGREAGDELLANTAYLLKNFKKTNKSYAHHLIFRMNGPRFTYYCNDVTKDEIVSIAEAVRAEFRESRLFITDITVSVGVVHSGEFSEISKDPAALVLNIVEVANTRLRLARHKGIDSVCSDSETSVCFDVEDYIMVIDPDISVRYMLETHLRGAGFEVITCAMGDEALEKIVLYKPQVIISGIMLPKIDGFSLRNKLLEDSTLKDIPFIITSANKNEKSIIRAQSLGIYHYFKKPFSIVELIGLVKNLSKAEL